MRKDNRTEGCSSKCNIAGFCRSFADLISFTRRHKPARTFADLPMGHSLRNFPFALSRVSLGYRFGVSFYDIKLLQAHVLCSRYTNEKNNPFPSQDRRTKACTLFQSLAFPHRLGPAHEPRARTQPSKHKQSQSLIACDNCKNKPVHEVTPFRPLSTNAQKSCCSRTTYQHELNNNSSN